MPMKFYLIIFLVVFQCYAQLPEKSMVIVVPSWNNNELFNGVPRYQLNLDSIFSQKYAHYRVIYIDDCSSDATAVAVEQYVAKKGFSDRVTLIKNKKRWGPSRNRYIGAHLAQDNEIVMYLDGDDWFSNPQVLNKVNNAYSDPNVWLTYSQFIHAPDDGKTSGAKEIPQWVIKQNAYRQYGWYYHSLKTFYGWLFKKLRLEDILFEGNFFPVGSDIAEMFPLVELSGGHFKFIQDVLYVASVHGANEINITGKNLLNKMWQVISNMEPYDSLKQRSIVNKFLCPAVDLLLFVGNKNILDINSSLNNLFDGVSELRTTFLFVNSNEDKLKAFNFFRNTRKNFNRENIVIKCLHELKGTDFLRGLSDNVLLSDGTLLTRSIDIKSVIYNFNMTYALLCYLAIDMQKLEHEKIPCLHVGFGETEQDNIYAFQFSAVKSNAVFKKYLPCICKKATMVAFVQSKSALKVDRFIEEFGYWCSASSKKIGLVCEFSHCAKLKENNEVSVGTV